MKQPYSSTSPIAAPSSVEEKMSPYARMRTGDISIEDNDIEDSSRMPTRSFSIQSNIITPKSSPSTSPKSSKKLPRGKKNVNDKPAEHIRVSESTKPTSPMTPGTLRVSFNESQQYHTATPHTSRAVSFNKRVRIRKIRTLGEMSKEEIQATYFTEKDLIGIRNGLRTKIRSLVENNVNLHTDDYLMQCENDFNHEADESSFCIRGLEHEFPQGKHKRRQLKVLSRGAVMEEQRLQREFYVGRAGINGNCSSTSTHETTFSESTCSSHSNYSLMSGCSEDPSVAIAEIYRIESKPAVQLALEFARRDELIADQIYFSHQAI